MRPRAVDSFAVALRERVTEIYTASLDYRPAQPITDARADGKSVGLSRSHSDCHADSRCDTFADLSSNTRNGTK